MSTGDPVVPPSVRVRQVAPASVEYWYVRIGEPPSESGALKAAGRVASLPAIVSPRIEGAPGVVAGVTAIGAEAAPAPTAFTARRLTSYPVPLTSPVRTTGL